MHWLLVAALLATDVSRSVRLTSAAEQLLDAEKKMASASPEPISDLLFADVLSLLDVAVDSNPSNLHAHALRAQTLLLRSRDENDEYDVCYLIEARADATFVVSRASKATAPDVKMARDVLHGLDVIPPDAIPDPPSVCDDDEQQGSRTKTP